MDIDAALAVVTGELALPYLPELPARGVGADLIGRTVALLVDLPVEVSHRTWRVAGAAGMDLRRARQLLDADRMALGVALQRTSGWVKVQVAGPWTLATMVEDRRGHAALADRGLRADLTTSLTEGLAGWLATVRELLPSSQLVVQLDEPALPAALAGAVPTASGLGRLAPVAADEAQRGLSQVLAAVGAVDGVPMVHCCAADVPVAVLHRAGARILSFDQSLLEPGQLDDLGAAVDDGVSLAFGVLPSSAPPAGPEQVAAAAVRQVREVWAALGFAPSVAAEHTLVTPTCGLAGADAPWARQVTTLSSTVADRLADLAD